MNTKIALTTAAVLCFSASVADAHHDHVTTFGQSNIAAVPFPVAPGEAVTHIILSDDIAFHVIYEPNFYRDGQQALFVKSFVPNTCTDLKIVTNRNIHDRRVCSSADAGE